MTSSPVTQIMGYEQSEQEQPKISGKGKGRAQPQTQAKRNWIGELITSRHEDYMHDVIHFRQMIDRKKLIHVVTDGVVRPNPGAARWGVIICQNKSFTMVWRHFPHATNNTMELRAVAEHFRSFRWG
jgi:hypothetical protein